MFNDLKKKVLLPAEVVFRVSVCRSFSNKNSNIIILDIVKKKYTNKKTLQYHCDISNETSVKTFLIKLSKVQSCDILINNLR